MGITDIGNNPLVTYNWDPSEQLQSYIGAQASVSAGVPGTEAKIVAVGDSTTLGFGGSTNDYRESTSYPADLAVDLTSKGVDAQSDNFVGQGNEDFTTPDSRIVLTGGASWGYPFVAGGPVITTDSVGQGFTFTLDAPAAYNQVAIEYLDSGNGTLNVSANGGPAVASLQLGNTGVMMNQTVSLPLGNYSSLTVTTTTSNPTYIEGASFSNSARPAFQVVNAGEGGAESSVVGDGVTPGAGEISSAAALGANLALIEFGINDILQGNLTAAQTTENIGLMVTEFRAYGVDPVIIIPTPIQSSNYTPEIPILRADIYQLADSMNVPVIDLSATYDNSYTALSDAGLVSDYAHPDATLYADIAQGIAGLLTSLTSQAPVACYGIGTLILTDHGEIPVEHLAIGDHVMTAVGVRSVIRWIGRRSYAGRSLATNPGVQPILFRIGSLGNGLPRRDLSVSPGHAMFLDGMLIPARCLINGATIVQKRGPERVDYYHVELDRHDVLLAEGAASESFLDDDSRGVFQNAGEFRAIYPRAPAPAGFYAPRVESGFELETIRLRLGGVVRELAAAA